MAQYIFLQPYTIRTGEIVITSDSPAGGTGGTIIKSFNTGDIIEGTRKYTPGGIPTASGSWSIETLVNGQIFYIADYLVKEYISPAYPAGMMTSENLWTPKRVLIILTAIAAFIIIIRHFWKN